MQLFSFRILIGNNKSSLVPNDAFDEFYRQIALSIFKDNISSSSFFQLNIPIAPPLKIDWEYLNETLNNCFKIIKETNDSCCVLLHINEVIKPTNYYEIISLYEQLKELNDINTKAIFFLKNIENILFINPSLAKKVGLENGLVFLNDNGKYTTTDSEFESINNFNEFYSTIQLTEEDKLKLKLIRNVGHFIKEKDGNHVSCQKFFYDGTHCMNEMTLLLYELIISKIDITKSFGVYYYSPYSNWAKNCFLQIHEELTKNYPSQYFKKILIDEFEVVDQTILLTDVVVSGTTLRDKYNYIKQLSKQTKIVAFCMIDCFSNKLSDAFKGSIEIPNGDDPIKLHFLLQRNQISELKASDNCEMCKPDLDIPKKKFNEISSTPKLSSFEMWSMAIETGLHFEHTPPRNSEESKIRFPHEIPNTLEIVKFNGAYLASKFQELLKSNNLIFPISGFIAYPDETDNELYNYKNLSSDKVPSSLFVSSLRLIFRYNILPIPRSIIEEVKTDPSSLSTLRTNHSDFYKNYLLQVKNEPIIIVDEFPRTYETYLSMRRIFSEIGRTPLAYITLFNFSPDQAKQKVTDINHLNFYEFQIN